MTVKILPPVVVTGSRLLRHQLRLLEQRCGLDFDYCDRLPQARRFAARRETIILGHDVVPLVRQPWTCRGLVWAATLAGLDSPRLPALAHRAGATSIVALPTGASVAAETIWRTHVELHRPPTPGAHR
ncbi:hypothetical protein [Mangrovihabitans endophyticus]|uniref:Uncharacterized protein n=1 Tax=Mangrovihabitans endophyticus TaxID=1751298 RepID=A0A8J3C863_9ACTN|nr:hypothetical protein [Mangrovihabitans endophyticus]GGL17381.1 hypothetical protein GCM10012284_59910 [Mangrovihabitans endophyticus]